MTALTPLTDHSVNLTRARTRTRACEGYAGDPSEASGCRAQSPRSHNMRMYLASDTTIGSHPAKVIRGETWREGSLVTLEKSWVDFVDLVDECEVDDVHC